MTYYWVVDFVQGKKGVIRPVVIGGRAFTSSLKAQKYIDEAGLSQKAEVFELPTSNQSKATQMIKAELVRRFRNLGKGITRAVHHE